MALVFMECFAPRTAAAQTNYSVLYRPTSYPKYMFDGRPMPFDIKINHVWDGYLTSQLGASAKFIDNFLLSGGNGYYNRTYLRFDTVGLPKQVSSVSIYFRQGIGPGKPTTPVKFYRITGTWTPAAIRRYLQPVALLLGSGYGPKQDAASYHLTGVENEYRRWQDGTSTGLRIDPINTNDTYNGFHSSRTPQWDGSLPQGPALAINFTAPAGMPSFRMPLPGGHEWLVTTEIGGYDCRGGDKSTYWPDDAHRGDLYYSLDFSPRTKGGTFTGPVPILAAADGLVAYAAPNALQPNGNYITLNHSGKIDVKLGYTTKYLHLADRPKRKDGTLLKKGDIVARGDQIGIMGTTGVDAAGKPTSTGVHLHFGVYFNGKASVTEENLSYVVMDARLLKSYQTACTVNSKGWALDYNAYYMSANYPTGR